MPSSHVSTLSKELEALAGAGLFETKDAQVLLDAAAATRSSIDRALVLPLLPAIALPCVPKTGCQFLVLHVKGKAGEDGSGKPDGSSSAPYRTIGDALGRAAAEGACGVEIVLAGGTYDESIVVTRDLRIRGEGAARPVIEGSILNTGGHDLRVSDVHLRGSPDPGAIVVDGACPSATELIRVEISGATRNGLLQRGGTLRGFALLIRQTRALADERHAGAGIRLTDGVQAALGLLDISNNGAGGLSIEGEGTRVYLSVSLFSENRSNPFFLHTVMETGAVGAGIEVERGALLLAEFTNVVRNDFVGLLVREDAQAHFRYGRIERTRLLSVDLGAGPRSFGSFNASSIDRGVMELSGFTLAHSEVCDLTVARAYASASFGVISDAPVGVCVTDVPADFDTVCLRHDVDYVRLGVPLQGSRPLPCMDCPPPPPCATVPFSCTWCGVR